MATALIVVESYFGNTRLIAEAVAAGMIEGGVDTQVVDASEAPSSLPADLDLIVLGAPTHNRGLPTAASRTKAREQAGSGEASPGIGEWLGAPAIPASPAPAAVGGSAAKAIAKALQRHQGRRTSSVRSFVVTASKGPLADGEKTDAHSWGRELAASANGR